MGAILILFFLDAIREMQKYSTEEQNQNKSGMSHLDAQMQMHMRLFRAQRNFYIAGFALFLCLVINRLVGLIIENAAIEKETEITLNEADNKSKVENTDEMTALRKALDEETKIIKLNKEILDQTKSRSESLREEYENLLEVKNN